MTIIKLVGNSALLGLSEWHLKKLFERLRMVLAIFHTF